MADVSHGINVLWRYRFFQPEQAERLEFFCDALRGAKIVAAMHVTRELHFFRNGFAHMFDPANHAINLSIVRGPVHPIEAIGVSRIIEVNLHSGEALILDPWKFSIGLW